MLKNHQAKLENEQLAWEKNRQSIIRLENVVEWLGQKCRDGSILGYYRLQSGGMLSPMNPSDWNTENPLRVFVSQGGYKRWIYSGVEPKHWLVYIFFNRAEIDRLTEIFIYRPVQLSSTELSNLSPYLQAAVKIALRNNYTSQGKGRSDSAQVRGIEVREAWAEALPDVPITDRGVDAIAWIMSFPNPSAIEKGKLGGVKRKSGSPGRRQE